MTEFFAFYGSLRRDAVDAMAPGKADLVAYRGTCRLAGTLRAHGPYPGYFPSVSAGLQADPLSASAIGPEGVVLADLYEVLRPEAFPVFDGWEDYDPANEETCPYLRRLVRPIDSGRDVWVYVSCQSAHDPLVPDGDWLAYLDRRGH
ncbi:MAG: gamma-glutamylcyclotransferase family protein [Pseudomonadota bacterium]|nr:gamma-glutamylcyclotransferase family protein [Pseudomonadota bacterium]